MANQIEDKIIKSTEGVDSVRLSSAQTTLTPHPSPLPPGERGLGDIFTEFYNQLNDEQKLAVDTIEGPVMVIAGPGTGKTQILTLRIANILQNTQMNPRNILALTFTDNAATNMRKRLISIIGPAAYSVSISTFHGFANSVISDFPYKFQFAKELQQIDDVEQIEIIEKLLDSVTLIELRPPRAPYHYLKEVLGRISELKRENVSPKKLKQIAQDRTKELNGNPNSYHEKGAYKGKMKAVIVDELKHLVRCQELVALYEGYQQALQEKGLYDYDDMILFVINQFEKDSELKAYYQERYQYILVDEYQDTNTAQNKLIEQLSDFFESPNLFVVGDDKQSIYRFQGASMANLLAFHERYPDMKVITLKRNYRSNQTILDGAQEIIQHATDRITKHLDGIEDTLIASNQNSSVISTEASPSGENRKERTDLSTDIRSAHSSRDDRRADLPPISLGSFSTRETEIYWIVTKIEQLIQQGSEPHEIAVIYKENREAEAFADLMGRLNIPFSLERGTNVLIDTDVRRLLTILQAIADPTDSRSVFEYLHYDFTGVQGTDILKLMAYRAKTHMMILDVLDSLPCDCEMHATPHPNLLPQGEKGLPDTPSPLRGEGRGEKIPKVHFTDCQKIEAAYGRLADWRIASANKSLPELLEQVLQESGLLHQITGSPTRIERLHRLRRLFDEVKRISLKRSELTLEELLAYFNLLITNNIQLVPEPLDLGDREGTVRLMTAHKAKGLEFAHVFIPNIVDKHWGNATRRTLIKLPHTIIALAAATSDEKNEDDRRLFYVALTRARQCLYLTYARTKDGKELLPSQFITELSPQLVTPIETEPGEKQAEAHLLALFTPIAETTFTDQEAAYLRQVITEQPITPTGLNNYLRCPKGYFYKNLLRIPTAKTAQQGYGTAIHAAMQAFFMAHKATKHVPTLEDLLGAFKDALEREILSPVEHEAFLKLGTQTLTAYFQKNLHVVTPTVAVEYSFASHHVILPSKQGDIQLTGILDKLELIDPQTNAVRVIDYKTGRARSRNEIEGKTARADEDYKRQLIFYQLLSELDPQFPYKVVETGLSFVDDDGRFPTELFKITRDEVQDLKQLIQNVYEQMLSLEFPHIEDPSHPPCEFCTI